jgi:hypothetical protein
MCIYIYRDISKIYTLHQPLRHSIFTGQVPNREVLYGPPPALTSGLSKPKTSIRLAMKIMKDNGWYKWDYWHMSIIDEKWWIHGRS